MNIAVVDFIKRIPDQYDLYLKSHFKLNYISQNYAFNQYIYQLPDDLILIHSKDNHQKSLELYKEVKIKYPWTPVVFVNYSATEEEVVEALSLGVDDFIQKQITPKEFVARIHNKVRKKSVKSIKFDGGSLDFDSFTFEYAGKTFELTDIEFKILVLLVNNPNKIVSKEAVYNFLWKSDSVNLENLNSHVYNIRKKIYPFSDCIQTIRKTGYMIKFPVEFEVAQDFRLSG